MCSLVLHSANRTAWQPPQTVAATSTRGARVGSVGIGGVIGGRPVAILALNARQLWSFGQADETSRQAGTDGVARQTGDVGLAPAGGKRRVGEGAGMGGMRQRVEDGRMAFRAGLPSGVLGRRAGDAKERPGKLVLTVACRIKLVSSPTACHLELVRLSV